MSETEEQPESGGDGWIDASAGRWQSGYGEDDDAESSTYFHSQAKQGQKRKKAPFFKYSKKRKGYGNGNSNSKGSVLFVSHCVVCSDLLLFIAKLFFLSPCLVWLAVVPVVATAPISRGHHPAPKVDQRLQAGGLGARREMHLQAGDQASCLSRPLKPTSDLS